MTSFFRVIPLLETSNINNNEERKLPLSLPFSYQDIYETNLPYQQVTN